MKMIMFAVQDMAKPDTENREQAGVIQNHENDHVHSIGHGEARHRKYRLKLGSDQAYDRSSD
jgi:hypothetical protein